MLRRKLICAGVMLAATLAGLQVLYFATAPRVTMENYEKIHDGLVLADVEALLGRPAAGPTPAIRYLFGRRIQDGTLHRIYGGFETSDEALEWHDNGGRIFVAFRQRDAVTYKRYVPPPDDPLLVRLRRLLRN